MDMDRTHQLVLIIRCVVAIFLLIGGLYTHGFCQPKKEAGVLSLTLSEAVDLALSANRSLRQVGYSLQSQTFSLQSSRSEFDLKLKPASRAGVIDGQGVPVLVWWWKKNSMSGFVLLCILKLNGPMIRTPAGLGCRLVFHC